MTKIKNVVKVMNFHSLLRVDSAKKQAMKYEVLESELTEMISHIVNNRNFILDKKIMKPAPSKPVLNIYIGSDYGFCSNFNSQVNEMLMKDTTSDKIIVGKKTRDNASKVLLRYYHEEFSKYVPQVEKIVETAISEETYREINVIYNHYTNASDIHLEKKKIYPLEMDLKQKGLTYDYVIESDVNTLLRDVLILYVIYQIRICRANAFASENVLRQNTTSESLKKIDEREDMALKAYRKEKKAKEFRKAIESLSKLRAR